MKKKKKLTIKFRGRNWEQKKAPEDLWRDKCVDGLIDLARRRSESV